MCTNRHQNLSRTSARLCHIGNIMMGVAFCTLLPQVGAVVSTWFFPDERTTAIGIFNLYFAHQSYSWEMFAIWKKLV